MKSIFLFLSAFSSYYLLTGSCNIPSIESSYKSSEVIFIGKFKGNSNFNGKSALPLKINNFEVLKFIKGPDIKVIKSIALQKFHQVPIVSLLDRSNEGCGIEFIPNGFYLVFAYKDYSQGILTTNGCARTRSLNQHKLYQYLDSNSQIPEIQEINKWVQLDKKTLDTMNWEARLELKDKQNNYVPLPMHLDLAKELKTVTRERNVWITLASAAMLALLSLAFMKRSK